MQGRGEPSNESDRAEYPEADTTPISVHAHRLDWFELRDSWLVGWEADRRGCRVESVQLAMCDVAVGVRSLPCFGWFSGDQLFIRQVRLSGGDLAGDRSVGDFPCSLLFRLVQDKLIGSNLPRLIGRKPWWKAFRSFFESKQCVHVHWKITRKLKCLNSPPLTPFCVRE